MARTTNTMRSVMSNRRGLWLRFEKRGWPVTRTDRQHLQLVHGIELRQAWAARRH